MADDPIEIVKNFAGAFRAPIDIDAIADSFTEDGVFHNMPMDPWVGREAIRSTLRAMTEEVGAVDIEFDIRNIAADGNRVYSERVDWITLANGVRWPMKCLGVWELRNGKIAEFRDYMDLRSQEQELERLMKEHEGS